MHTYELGSTAVGVRPNQAEHLTEINHRANWPRLYASDEARHLGLGQRLFGEGSPSAPNFTCLA